MKREIGLWIDHRKAVIITDEGEEIKIIESNMEKHVRFSGGSSEAGQAEGELEKRLGRKELKGRIVGIEIVDKMTDRQIAAKVRDHFQA